MLMLQRTAAASLLGAVAAPVELHIAAVPLVLPGSIDSSQHPVIDGLAPLFRHNVNAFQLARLARLPLLVNEYSPPAEDVIYVLENIPWPVGCGKCCRVLVITCITRTM